FWGDEVMKYRLSMGAAMMMAASLTGLPAMAQRAALSSAEVAQVQADVKAAADYYDEAFRKRDLRTIVDKVWAHPSAAISASCVNLLTPADVEANYTKTFADLAKTQYDHSDRTLSVCVISSTMAVISGPFKRIAKDGSVMMQGSLSYLYTKMSDGWHITMSL